MSEYDSNPSEKRSRAAMESSPDSEGEGSLVRTVQKQKRLWNEEMAFSTGAKNSEKRESAMPKLVFNDPAAHQ